MTKELIKTVRCELTGDFAEIWVEVRRNPPMRVYRDLASGDMDQILGALATMTRTSNLTDDNDQPIDLHTVDGWLSVSAELVGEVTLRIKEALGLPKASGTESSTLSPSAVEQSRPTTTT